MEKSPNFYLLSLRISNLVLILSMHRLLSQIQANLQSFKCPILLLLLTTFLSLQKHRLTVNHQTLEIFRVFRLKIWEDKIKK